MFEFLSSFEDPAPIDFIYGCPISKRVTDLITWQWTRTESSVIDTRVPCLYHPNNSLTGGYLAPRVGNYHSLVSDTERCPETIHWLQHSNSSLLGCHYMWSGSQWEPGRPPRCRQWGPMDPMTHLRNTPLMNIHNAAGLAQDCGNSSALAMELLQSCAKSSMSSTE